MTDKTDKRDKFVRLAQGRTQLALDAIQKIGNLNNPQSYTWTDADIVKIVKALKESIATLERRFDTKTEKKETFLL